MAKKQETPTRTYLTPDEQMANMSYKALKAIENRIDSGTATAQELIYYANYDPVQEKLKMEMAMAKIQQAKAKTTAIEIGTRIEETMAAGLGAFKLYKISSDEGEEI